MTTMKTYKPVADMVKSMRHIRDEISNEIKDMSFTEERNFLDKLLSLEKSDKIALQKRNKKVFHGK